MMVAIVGQYISQTDSTCQAQNNGINKLDFYKRRAIHMPPAFGARKLFIQKGLFDRKVRQLRRCSKLPLETTTAATSLSYRGNYAWGQKEDPSECKAVIAYRLIESFTGLVHCCLRTFKDFSAAASAICSS